MKKSFGRLEILEIIQIGTILFVSAAVVGFLFSLLFTELDKVIEKKVPEDYEKTKFAIKFVELFVQLLVTAVAYFYLEKFIYIFPSISKKINKNYVSYKSVNYVIHIVLIVLLLELNHSLVENVHYISKEMQINKSH